MRMQWVPIFLALTLASCINTPPINNPAPPGLTVRIENGNRSAAEARARQYCAQYGKHASLGSTSGNGADTLLSYSCD